MGKDNHVINNKIFTDQKQYERVGKAGRRGDLLESENLLVDELYLVANGQLGPSVKIFATALWVLLILINWTAIWLVFGADAFASLMLLTIALLAIIDLLGYPDFGRITDLYTNTKIRRA